MAKPIVKTEKEFSRWFEINYKKLGFSKIIKKNIATSPDFIMIKDAKEVGVELETLSSNFVLHKHKIDKINLVLCLVKDLELDIPSIVVNELEFKPKYRKVTLNIDNKVYLNFQKFCNENDINLSKRIERLMNEMLESQDKRWRK